MVEYRLPLNSRVRLRDGIDPALYKGFSCTGNEGWVRSHRQDHLGFPQVLIEWDHDHWAYNGAPNCWTWEDHFDIVGEDMAAPDDSAPKNQERDTAIRGLTETFLKGLFAALGASETEVEQADEEATGTTPRPEENNLDEAITALRDSKAFIVIAMREEKEGVIVPAIYQQAENEDLALICQAQLGHLATILHDALIHQRLQSKGD